MRWTIDYTITGNLEIEAESREEAEEKFMQLTKRELGEDGDLEVLCVLSDDDIKEQEKDWEAFRASRAWDQAAGVRK
jgi:hypothetical protein